MKTKNIFLPLLCVLFAVSSLNAQINVTEKGTKLLMGLGSFSMTKPIGYQHKVYDAALSASWDVFFLNNWFWGINTGGNVRFTSPNHNLDQPNPAWSVGIGPEIGYAFDLKTSVTPYLVTGLNIQRSDPGIEEQCTNLDIFGGAGLLIPFNENAGFVAQVRYTYKNYFKDLYYQNYFKVTKDSNIFSFNMGLVFFIR